MEPITGDLHTVDTLKTAFRSAGLAEGQTVLMHSAMSKIGGWVAGGAQAVILALLDVLTPDGTLVMPAHSTDNSDPANWENPPVPREWWDTVRAEFPAYDPATTITRQMGIIVETFRRWPGVTRSPHPMWSFAAWGRHADMFTASHPLEAGLGEGTPLSALYDLDGYIFLMGVGHGNNTSLHLSEYRAQLPFQKWERQSTAIYDENGQRQRVYFKMMALDDEDFPDIGAAYSKQYPSAVRVGQVGNAQTLFMRQRPLIDFGVTWMQTNRQPEEEA